MIRGGKLDGGETSGATSGARAKTQTLISSVTDLDHPLRLLKFAALLQKIVVKTNAVPTIIQSNLVCLEDSSELATQFFRIKSQSNGQHSNEFGVVLPCMIFFSFHF